MVDYVESPLEQIKAIFLKRPVDGGGGAPPGPFHPLCVPFWNSLDMPIPPELGRPYTPFTIYITPEGWTWVGEEISCCPPNILVTFYEPWDGSGEPMLKPGASIVQKDEDPPGSGNLSPSVYFNWSGAYGTTAIANGGCGAPEFGSVLTGGSVHISSDAPIGEETVTQVWTGTCISDFYRHAAPAPDIVQRGSSDITVDIPDPLETPNGCGTVVSMIYGFASGGTHGITIEHSCSGCTQHHPPPLPTSRFAPHDPSWPAPPRGRTWRPRPRSLRPRCGELG
jgi:hypothetical protein